MNNNTSKRQKQKKKKAASKAKSNNKENGGETLEMLDSEYSKLRSLGHKIPTPRPIAASEVAFGHNNDHLAHVDLEDEAFSSWYRKTAGMHTVRTWCENYQKHP